MIGLIWVALALADPDSPVPPPSPLAGQVGAWSYALSGAVGAHWWFHVGDQADLTRFDAVSTEHVAVAPLAVEGHLTGPGGVWAELRFEEGVVHEGAIEAADARVGLAAKGAWGSAYVGRTDIPVTRDRTREAEDLALSVRPLLSRATLPTHAAGAGGTLSWPDRVDLRAGLSYAAVTSDAPILWTRLDIHPFGPLPEDQEAPSDGPKISVAGGLADLDSPSLGTQRMITADLESGWGPARLGGGWVDVDLVDTAGTETERTSWEVDADAAVLKVRGACVRLDGRVERVTGLEEGEDARWLGMGRVALSGPQRKAELYGEALLSREEGTGVASGEDVVDLGASIERDNDAWGLGARVRF